MSGIEAKSQPWITWIGVMVLSTALAGCSGSIEPFEEELEAAASPEAGQLPEGSDDESPEGGGTVSNTPLLSLSASDLSVPEGGSVTLSWSASGADSCTASGGWSGELASSGNQVVGPVVAGTTFSLNCSGPGGVSLEMISVSVVGPVELSWIAPEENVDGSELVDLAGYKLYFGENSRDYDESIELTDTSATTHTLELPTGSYYFAMTAFDTEGHESNYSNEVVRHRP